MEAKERVPSSGAAAAAGAAAVGAAAVGAAAADPAAVRSSGYILLISAVAASGGLLFGFDTAIVAGAQVYFRREFQLDDLATEVAVSSLLVGCVLGASAAGWSSDRFGRRRMLLVAALLFAASAVGAAVPRTVVEFIAARLVGGIAIGVTSMQSPMYIAEVSPAESRGRLVTLNQTAIITGILAAYVVAYLLTGAGPSNWRWMFGLAAVPALAFWIALLFVPESPRWLVKQGRTLDAFAVLERVGGRLHAESELREIEDAAAEGEGGREESPPRGQGAPWPGAERGRPDTERSRPDAERGRLGAERGRPDTERSRPDAEQGRPDADQGRPSAERGRPGAERGRPGAERSRPGAAGLSQLFQPGLRTALGIGVALAILQQVTGINTILYYAPTIFLKAGFTSEANAFLASLAVGAVNFVFTGIALAVIDRLGRKPLLLLGSGGMAVSLALLGATLRLHGESSPFLLAAILSYVAFFALGLGPVVWLLLSEIFPTRIRGRAMSLATISLWIACFAVSLTFLSLVNALSMAGAFWLYAVLCAVTFVFVWRVLPETRGKSLEEIERSWRRAPA